MTYEGNTRGSYVYNGLSQLITRTVSNMGSGVDGTVHYVHDAAGNIIAETDGTGAVFFLLAFGKTREYIWIPPRSDRFASFHAKRESAAQRKWGMRVWRCRLRLLMG